MNGLFIDGRHCPSILFTLGHTYCRLIVDIGSVGAGVQNLILGKVSQDLWITVFVLNTSVWLPSVCMSVRMSLCLLSAYLHVCMSSVCQSACSHALCLYICMSAFLNVLCQHVCMSSDCLSACLYLLCLSVYMSVRQSANFSAVQFICTSCLGRFIQGGCS